MKRVALASESVIDVSPWPAGLGFKSSEIWWDYVRSRPAEARLELLILVALLNPEVGALLLKHNADLFEHFGFSEEIRLLLSTIEADSLAEFAEILLLCTAEE